MGPSPSARSGLRRGLTWGCLPALAVFVVVVLIVVIVVRRNADNQSISLPPGGLPVPTGPVVTLPGSGATSTIFSIVQQPWGPRVIGWASPAGLGPTEKVPLVILLHGLGAGPQVVFTGGSWADAVSKHRILVETPSGVQNSWNAGGCCLPARALGVDDVAYLDAVLDDAVKRPNVDPDRIFLVGQSNGGMMAYRYACTKGNRLAGLASVTGTNVSGCEPNADLGLQRPRHRRRHRALQRRDVAGGSHRCRWHDLSCGADCGCGDRQLDGMWSYRSRRRLHTGVDEDLDGVSGRGVGRARHRERRETRLADQRGVRHHRTDPGLLRPHLMRRDLLSGAGHGPRRRDGLAASANDARPG